MKQATIDHLEKFKQELQALRKSVSALTSDTVSRTAIRDEADRLASCWVEKLRSPLEHKFKIAPVAIEEMAALMKQLHVLSRPSNRKASYLRVLNSALAGFDNKYVLPIKQSAAVVESIFDLQKLVPQLPDPDESEYLKEAVQCAQNGHKRAAIVMGWCCAIDKIQKHIQYIGFASFNAASTKLKNQTSGKYKRWTKEYSVSSLAELQTVFDTDLIIVCEGLDLLDGNQAERLETCFQYRNHSAHPGLAPIDDPNVVAFFSDITAIILRNLKFNVAPTTR